LLAAAATVAAQEPPAPTATWAPLEEIVVTGSRLPTTAEAAISPVTSVSAAAVQQTGLTRVEDILNLLPMVFPSTNANLPLVADGTAAVNLRGLGNQRTLVLVDGLRLGPGGPDGRNWSDLNQIPSALVERIDILTGGASAVYGADAVAGVVNFIISTRFEGVKLDAGYHVNQHNNDNQSGVAPFVTAAGFPLPRGGVDTGQGANASLIAGSSFAELRGNVTGYVTYDKQDKALQTQYDYSACVVGPVPISGPYTGLACTGSYSTAGGTFWAFDNNGNTLFRNTVDQKTGAFRPFAPPGDTWNYAQLNYFLTPNTRWTGGAFVDYEFSSSAQLYANVMYMRNSMNAQISPDAYFLNEPPVFIPCADPLLTREELATLCTPANLAANGGNYEVYNGKNYPGLNVYLGRRNAEGGGRVAAFVNDALRAVLGVKGNLGGDWTYNVHAQRGTVTSDQNNENYIGVFQAQQGLNVLPGPSGPICGGPTSATATTLVSPGTPYVPNPGCVPWNIWVPNKVTPAALAFMAVPLTVTGSVTEEVVSASVTGDLGRQGVKLPSAQQGLQLNAGVEWREERSDYLPNEEEQQGNAGGPPVQPVAGEFTVRELFTEIRLPLATQKMLAEDLFVEGGYRYSRYSQGFDTDTYKLGLVWAPIQDLRLRGSYQRAVRAPNISEYFSPQIINSADGSVDPCAGTPTASLAACELTGVKPNQYGHIPPSPLSQYNGLTGGNPDLKPEVAQTYTAGLVVQPHGVPNLQLSLDYFNIRIAGVMGVIGADTIMLNCLASVGNPAQQARFCPQVHRDSLGSLWLGPDGYISDLIVNEGELSTAGTDVSASYRVPLSAAGSLSFGLTGTHLQSLKTTPVAGFGSYDCVGYFGAACNVAPKWRHVFNVGWSTPWKGFELNLRWRYIAAVESEQTSTNSFLAGTPYLPLAHIPAYSYFDLAGSINVGKNVHLRLGVNNIADKVPPLMVGIDCGPNFCNGNTAPGFYDVLGRYLFAHVTLQF
jgi:outer membrane receptor protein involved in Fe transport